MRLRKPGTKLLTAALLALCTAFLATGAAADDTDIYRSTVRNNALMLIDLSGSMSLPVYDHNIDYRAIIEWAEGDATPEQAAVCVRQTHLGSGTECYGSAVPYKDGTGNMLWDRNRIYLVTAKAGWWEVTDEDGDSHSVTQDPLWDGGPQYGIEEWLIEGGIIDTGWDITNWDDPVAGNTIETNTGTDAGYVVYPSSWMSLPVNAGDGNGQTGVDPVQDLPTTWYNTTSGAGLSGERLKNHQDILLTDVRASDTGVVRDYGFLGYLQTAGIYLSGLFRGPVYNMADMSTYLAHIENHYITDDPTESYNRETYFFVTGNYLSFLKLAEDLAGNDTASCTESGNDWRDICYQPGTGFTYYSKKAIRSHGENHREDFDYFSSGHGAKGVGYWHLDDIDPAGNIGNLQIQFEFIDTDACSSIQPPNWNAPDFAEFRTAEGQVILQIKGQEVYPGQAGVNAGYRLDNSGSWQPFSLDANGWFSYEFTNLDTDKVEVYFYNAGGTDDNDCEGTDCGGDPECEYKSRGFVVEGYRYTSSGTGSSEFECCNGPDGVGYKIQSRLEIAQKAMENVVDATREKLNWGLAVFPDYSGTTAQGSAELRTDFDEGADAVIADINALNAYGSTPTGEALELSYNYYDNFLEANADSAQCSNNFIVLMTDGYPNRDDVWTYVTTNTTTNPDFSGNQYSDGDSWAWQEGSTTADEHADDVTAWMADWQYAQPAAEGGTEPDFAIKTHAIGFNFDNKILEDVAEDGGGYHITAYSREQLISAFYQLGLTMTSSVSFIAPVVSVDEANRTQSGDKLYMAFFKPEDDDYWKGNLKKYGLDWVTRTDCGRSEGEWTVVDADGTVATDCDGNILSTARSYWSASADGVSVDEGGAGGVLMTEFSSVDIASGPFYDFRTIYTYKNNNLVAFTPDTITNSDLGVATDNERYSIINFMYGYTFDADGSGNPVAKRNWILGDIIHSEPKVIEYLDPDSGLLRRYIAVTANDGMIHFFVDYDSSGSLTEGSELFAFIPSDLLDDLQGFNNIGHFYTVDGSPNLWRGSVIDDDGDGVWDNGEYYEKILVFGERRGGRSYWALDVTDPDPANWDVAWQISGGDSGFMALGQTWNKPQFARIRTGSSDFTDVCIFAGGYDPLEDNYPEPFEDDEDNPNGVYDSGTDIWDEDVHDLNDNDSYDKHNLAGADNMGRGIYVVDVTDGSLVESKDQWDWGFSEMRWCFPSDPAVVSVSPSRLLIYAPDIYGQIWRTSYTYTDTGTWTTYRIFKANPGSDLPSGDQNVPGNEDSDDTGRKMFAPPDVSYYGNCWSTYPVLYFGTGDREHPNYAMISNRFYAIKDAFGIGDISDETELLNLTCNELEDVTIPDLDGDGDGDAADVTIQNQLKQVLTSGQARGAYRVLGEQGDCVSGADDHTGEKMLSQPTLFFNNIYFSTYQPSFGSACSAGGNARVYALDYCWLASVFDLYSGNSTDRDIRDTYQLISSSSIPSGVRVITRSGEAAGIISVAGAVSGVGEDQTTKIPGPPAGVTRMLWETD